MVLVVIVAVGVACFCFYHGYIMIGVICLAGVSSQVGFIALTITAAFLFYKGHWIVGSLPILLMAWNLMAVVFHKNTRDQFLNRFHDDSTTNT